MKFQYLSKYQVICEGVFCRVSLLNLIILICIYNRRLKMYRRIRPNGHYYENLRIKRQAEQNGEELVGDVKRVKFGEYI